MSVEEIVANAAARTAGRVAGHHVLAIQDTTDVRCDSENRGVALHPTIAVDASSGALLGLVHAELLSRRGGARDIRKARALADKQSRRWLTGAEASGRLMDSAAALTVVGDREGDIYEAFAFRPAGVELLIRAGQDRALSDGTHLFAATEGLAEAGRMTVDLPSAPGRPARRAVLGVRFRRLTIARPRSRRPRARAAKLPEALELTLVEARELAPPAGATPAHWRLLTTHRIETFADARRIVGFYRQRWTIEQLFRTLKTKGFDIEALRIAEHEPFEKLVAAALVAAVTVLQLARERDGTAKRPLADAFDPDDQVLLERLSASLEGKTAKQKNPHPPDSLAFATWVLARLGGWTGYYGKPGPIVILRGLLQFQAINHGWALQDV